MKAEAASPVAIEFAPINKVCAFQPPLDGVLGVEAMLQSEWPGKMFAFLSCRKSQPVMSMTWRRRRGVCPPRQGTREGAMKRMHEAASKEAKLARAYGSGFCLVSLLRVEHPDVQD